MVEFNPYSREFVMDPYSVYAKLRDEAPVFYNEELNFYALSRYDDVVMAHRDAATFSSAGGITIEGHDAGLPLLLVQDQPQHSVAKGFVTKLFSRPRMAELDLFIRKRAIELIEELYEKHGSDGEFDFVKGLSVRLPLDVISELLSIPAELQQDLHELANETMARGDDSSAVSPEETMARALEIYMTLAAERRAQPRDDVVSTIIAQKVKDEYGNEVTMSDLEIAFRFQEMTIAGHETVAKALPNGAMAMQNFPDERAKLKADGSLIPNAVEEILRFDPPSQLQGRTTTKDVELHGVTIPAGSKTMLITGSATRDPRAFDNPDQFNVSRDLDQRSIYFGFGVHKCLGIHLARQEQVILWEEMFKRFPDFETDPNRVKRSILSNVRGVDSLPMRLGKRF